MICKYEGCPNEVDDPEADFCSDVCAKSHYFPPVTYEPRPRLPVSHCPICGRRNCFVCDVKGKKP